AQGLALFDHALAVGLAHSLPIRLDLPRRSDGSAPVPALFRALVRTPNRRTTALDAQTLRSRLLALPEDERRDAMLSVVREHVAAVLRYSSPAEIVPGQSFAALGIDSLTAIELRNRFAGVAGTQLPSSLVFDHPTPELLSGHLLGLLLPAVEPGEWGIETIGRLEAMLAEPRDENEVRKVTAQLETLLVRWRERSRALGGVAADDADDVDAVGEDELLRYIDDELGVS
ncbi:beta-ketoacyl reductase, partial [Streptomyces sp. NPDC052101]|uniref:acyl carrier protein n=1 Tax=Streptomyces sp. NPDC052101 TaxID=3155763 RepID=UPI00341FBF55